MEVRLRYYNPKTGALIDNFPVENQEGLKDFEYVSNLMLEHDKMLLKSKATKLVNVLNNLKHKKLGGLI